jgi:D-psicose/D-tagatose/L-ribulose 3-epimerase
MTRREVVQPIPAACALASPGDPFRFSICNETFSDVSFEEQCRLARKIGYGGIEVMPGALTDQPLSIPQARRRELRHVIGDHGLTFVGLHNLLTVPKGMQAVGNDQMVRQRTWDFVRGLIDLCADLGPGGIMAFGSGKQRNAEPGVPIPDALARFKEGLAFVAPYAIDRGVTVLIEPLAPHFSNLVNRLAAAVDLVREIDSPAVQTMFDVHNTVEETLSGPELIDKYTGFIRHVHLNEMDGRRPGTGSYDFASLLRALERRHYDGWLSLEVFDFDPGGDMVASDALLYLKRAIGPA